MPPLRDPPHAWRLIRADSLRQRHCLFSGVRLRALGDTRGFSLLEALIAAAILASALLSLAQLVAFAVKTTAAAGRMTDAALLAAQKVEELRAGSWGELQPGTDSPAAGFTRTWTVTPLGADPDYLALLEVLVRAPGGQTRMIALKTKPPAP
jgi:type II secretory pathway pseudopilin PulG